MFEATLAEGGMLKKLMESIKDLVSEANFECSSSGIQLQAMDSSHVSLVAMHLRAEGFQDYRADRPVNLGINLLSMAKVLKCATDKDRITLRSDDNGDNVTFVFENPKSSRVSDFELKLMSIDSEHLGIPDTDYECCVEMPSSEFQRICREIAIIGDTVQISATKEGVKFSVSGDMGSGNVVLRQNPNVEKGEVPTVITIDDDVSLTFALRYLNFFAKATPLSSTVSLKMSKDVPLVVEYKMEDLGHIRFYLAPKIEDDE
jgi:proliferating cell nuclear antigen